MFKLSKVTKESQDLGLDKLTSNGIVEEISDIDAESQFGGRFRTVAYNERRGSRRIFGNSEGRIHGGSNINGTALRITNTGTSSQIFAVVALDWDYTTGFRTLQTNHVEIAPGEYAIVANRVHESIGERITYYGIGEGANRFAATRRARLGFWRHTHWSRPLQGLAI